MRRLPLTALLASTSLSAVGSLFLAPPFALANPQGGSVVGGGASIVQSPATPNRLVIDQTTESAVLNWQSFSIGAGEQVIFQQPNSAAIALNRVTGNQASEIAGTLTANGQVWLVNPNGVFFGHGAVVNVAGIIVSTSGIGTANFMAGHYLFDRPGAPGATVVNAGRVTVRDGGLAAFVAPGVANSGVINARLGKVALASGSTFTVDLYGDNLVKFAVNQQTASALTGAAVDNSGTIKANGGTVTLSVAAAQSIVDNAINVGGTIEARTASMQNGKIVLSGGGGTVTVGGTLDASGKGDGQTGGTVAVLGGAVDLAATATIDVSGAAGGGTALIGGNFHGAGPAPNAVATTVAAGAVIDADAIASGNGGNVAVWSDMTTEFDGAITARGGAAGGNGGYVETSSQQTLAVGSIARVDTSAPNGSIGTWLLDPKNIDVVSGGITYPSAGTLPDGTANNALDFGTDAGASDTVDPSAIESASATVVLQATNNITFSSPVTLATSGVGITAQANNSIVVLPGAAITTSGGNITFTANASSFGTPSGTGGISIAAALSTAGGGVTGGAVALTVAGGTGVISLGPDTSTATPNAGSITTAGGTVTIAGPTVVAANGTDPTTYTIDTTNAAATTTGANISFSGTVDGSALSVAGAGLQALTLQAGSAGVVALQGNAGSSTALGAITLNDAALDLAANVGVTTSNGAFSQTGATVLQGAAATATTIATSGGNIGFSGTIDGTSAASQALTLAAGTGTVSLSGNVGSSTALGAVTLTGGVVAIDASLSGGAISVAGSSGILFDNAGSGAAVTSTGGQVYSGAITLQAATTLTDTGGGAITFENTIDGGQALSVSTIGGTIALAANLGSTTPLGAVTLTDGLLEIAANVGIATSDVAFSQTGATVLQGAAATATTIATSGGNIGFSGTIDGTSAASQALTLAAGTGTVSLSGNVGSSTALGAVTLTGGVVAIDASLSGGAISVAGSSGILFDNAGSGAAVTSTGGQVYSGAITLQAATTLTDTGGGAITFENTIDGGQALSVSTIGGTIALAANVGSTTPLGAVTLTDGLLEIAANVGIATSDVAVSQTGATVLQGAAATATTIATSGGNIGFSGTIDGTSAGSQALTLAAGTGTVSLSGNVGSSTALGAVTLTGGVVAIDASLSGGAISVAGSSGILFDNAGGGAAVTSTGGQVYSGAITLQAATTLTDTGGGAITFQNTIDGGQALNVSTIGGTIALAANVGSTTPLGAVTLTDGLLEIAANVGIATSDGAVSQTGATVLQGATATATTIATAGGNIAFSSAIDGTSAGSQALTLAAGAGTISLAGNVGSTTALGAVSLTDGLLDIAANIGVTTSDGAFTQTGATLLQGGATASLTTIATSGGDIAFSGTISATTADVRSLALEAGTGTVALSGAVGSGVALGTVTLTGGTVAIDTTVSGSAISLTASSRILFDHTGGGVTVTSAGDGQDYSGAVTLQANTTLTDTGDGAITFGNTIDGKSSGVQALSLHASTGTITLAANVGATTPLGAVTLTDDVLDLAANVGIVTAGGAVSQTGATVLAGGATSTATSIATTAGGHSANISFDGAIDGTSAGSQALSLAAGTGTIALAANVGATTPLGAVTLTDGVLDIAANVGITTSNGAFSQSGATVLQGATTTLTTIATSGGNIGFSSAIDGASAGKQSLSLAAGVGTITLSGNVGAATALGAVTLTGGEVAIDASLSGGAIGVAGSSGILFDNAGGGATVTSTGGQTYSGAITLQAATTLTDTGGGAITFQNTIDGSSSGSQALAVSTVGGTIALAANAGSTTALGAVTLTDGSLDIAANVGVTTSGAAFTQTGATLLQGGATASLTTIATSGGNIAFSGTIAATIASKRSLALEAGAGTITLSGAVGSGTALGAVTLTGGAVAIDSSVAGGAISIAGSNGILFDGSGAAVTSTSGQIYSGAITLLAGTSLTDTGGSAITFENTIDGGQALSVSTPGGTIALAANVGLTTPLGAVTLTDGGLDLAANVGIVTAGGAVSQTGAMVLGGVGTMATATTIATTAGGHSANISFDGTIDGASAGSQALSLGAGTGTIALSGAVGSATALGGITLGDGLLDLAANVGITTSNGAFSQSGATVLQGATTTATTIATSGGNIGFSSTIDGTSAGKQSLSLAAGGGTITLSGNVGSATALGAVTLTGGEVAIDASLSGGAISVAGSGGILFDGSSATVTSTAGQTYSGAITLLAGTSLTDTGGNAITFDNTIDGDQALTVSTIGGTIALSGNVGATAPLGAVTLTDGQLDIAANVGIVTSDAAFSQTGATLLQGAAATATTIATSGGNITFSSTIDAASADNQALHLNAGAGIIALSGTVGSGLALSSLSLADARLDLSASVTLAGDFSQSGPALLQGGAGATTTTIASSAGNIAFSSAINADQSGKRALILSAGDGTIALQGKVGGTTALGAVTLSDAVLDLSANVGVTTSNAAFSQTGATVLLGGATASASTIKTSNGDITFSSTISGTGTGAQALTLNAGTGTIAFEGDVGTGSALGAVTLGDAVLDLSPNLSIATSSAAFSQSGATILLGGATTIATSGGTIGFSSTIDGTSAGSQSLTLNAGTGTIALSGAIGADVALGAIVLEDTELTLGPNVGMATSGGAISETGATLLLGGASATTSLIDTTAGGSTGATISFAAIDGTSAGSQALDLAAGSSGTIVLSGTVGAATALGAVTLSAGGPIAIANTLTTSGGNIFVTSGSNISITAPVDAGVGGAISLAASGGIDIASRLGATATGAITLDADSGQTGNPADALTIAAAVGNPNAGTMILRGAAITLGITPGATIDGGGALTIGPSTGAANIGLGDGSNAAADTFHVSSSGIGSLGSDFTAVSIATTSGTVHVDNGGASLLFLSPLTIAGAAIELYGNLSTTGRSMSLIGPVTLENGAALDTTASASPSGGNITFSSTVDAANLGTQGLTLDAGTAGTIVLSGNIGSATPLGAVAFTDKALDLAPDVGIATLNAAFSQGGATLLGGGASAAATTIATSGGSIAFGGPIDATSPGQQALILNAGTGTIALSGAVGAGTALGAITLNDMALDLAANVGVTTSNGAFSQSGATLLLGGATATATTIATSGGNIGFSGTIDGTSSGSQSLRLAAGGGTIVLSGAVGSATALGAVTLTGGLVAIDASVSGGAISVAGSSGILIDDTGGGAAVTSTGGQIYSGAITLQAATSLTDTGGGVIVVQGTIDGTSPGGQALGIGTGGTITLSGAVGAMTPLGAVTLEDAALDLGANVGVTTSDAAFSQTGATVLQGGGSGGATTIATSGGNIGFAGTIDGTAAGQQTLTLNAGTGTGTIALSGSIGQGKALGAITLNDAVLDIGANVAIATSDGAFSETGASLLQGGASAGAATIATSGGAVSFAGSIDATSPGQQALTLNAGAGTIALVDAVGAATSLGAVTLVDKVLDLAANVGIATSNAAVSQSGATVLGGAGATAATVATSGGTIAFGGTIDGTVRGDQALALDAGTGTVALSGNVGATTALGAVTLTDTVLALGANVGIATANASLSQSGATLLGGTGATATTIATSGGAIAFGGTIDGAVPGDQALTLNAGSGSIALSGTIGASTALGAVTLTDTVLALAANVGIATSDAAFSQSGATLLGGAGATATTISTSGGTIAFGSTIDGAAPGNQSLTLDAGTGTIALAGAVGAATALSAVTLVDTVLDLAANVGIATSDAAVSQSGATVLGGAGATVATISTSGGTIAFGGTIDGTARGDQALTLDAGTGTVALSGTVGATTALGAVTLTDTVLALGANVGIATSNASFSQSGATLLAGAGATAATIATSGGTIAFGGTIDGAVPGDQALTLNAGAGSIALSGNVGANTALGAVTLTDTVLALGANVGIATSNASVSQSGATLLGGAGATATTISTSSGNVAFGGTIDGAAPGDQSLSLDAGAGTIALSGNVGSVTPLGAVTLTDGLLDLAANVGIATSNAAVSQSGATVLLGGAGAGTTTIATSGGAISFGATIDGTAAGDQALSLNAGAGAIALSGSLGSATKLGAVTLTDTVLDLAPNVAIATANAAISQSGATLLGGANPGATTLASSGGTISFGGPIDDAVQGNEALTLAAGGGTIALAANVGSATPLGAVTLTDGLLDLAANVGIATANAAISQSGATVLGGAVATATTIASSGGTIAFAGTIDGTSPDQQALVLSAGAGTIALSGSVGSATPLGAVTFEDALLTITGTVEIATGGGAVVQTGATVLQGGASATSVTIASSGGDIGFASTIDGDGVAPRSLSLAAGTGTISLAGNVGSGAPLGAVTLTDAVLELAANVGIATANAAVSQSGATVLGGAGTTATTIATSGGNLGFGGTIDGSVPGDQALILAAGSGTIALAANVGASTPLGAVTITDGALTLAANVGITTSDAAISLTGATVLGGTTATAATFATSGGDLTIAGSLDGTTRGDQALVLAADTGTIALSGALGKRTALAALTLIDGALEIAGNGSIATAGGAFIEAGPFVLPGGTTAGSVTIDTTDGGAPLTGANITFSSTIDASGAGKQSLTLEAGTGTIALQGNVGATTPLAALTMSDAALELAANIAITTAGGSVAQSGPTVLGGGISPSTATVNTTSGGNSANISFDGTIDGGAPGAQALILTAGSGGTVSLLGTIGGNTALGAVTLSGGAIDLGANVGINTVDAAVSAMGPVVLLAGTAGSSVAIDTQGGAIAFSSTVDASAVGGAALSLAAGTGTITLQGSVGAATALGALTLDDAELDLAPGISIMTAGGTVSQTGTTVLLGGTGGGTVAVDTAGGNITFSSTIDATAPGAEALSLNAGAGTIALRGDVGATTALGAFTVRDAALDLPGNARIVTANGAVSQSGATLLVGTTATGATIDTTNGNATPAGANITFAGTIDGGVAGGAALTLNAGSSGTIALMGNVGGATALGAVTLSDAELLIAANVDLTTASGAVSETAATVLLGTGPTATAIDTTDDGHAAAGASITFGGTVDGSIAGDQALTLNAGTAGIVGLDADLGGATALGAVTMTDEILELAGNANITTAGGAVSETGMTVVAPEPIILNPGMVAPAEPTIDTTGGGAAPSGANIAFNGTVDGVLGPLSLTPTVLTLNAGTGGTITLTANVGAPSFLTSTPLTSLTLIDRALDIASNISIATGTSFSQTGATVLLAGTAPSLNVIGTSAGNITFAGPIDAAAAGAQGLTLDAGGAGTIALQGNVGKTTPLGALSLTDGLLDIGPNVSIVTAGGAVSNTGPVSLLGGATATATTIDTSGGVGGVGANIAFGAGIDGSSPGAQAFVLDAGSPGTIALQQSLGASTALGAVTLSAAAIDLAPGVGITTSGGAVSVAGAVLLAGSATLIDTTNAGQAGPGAAIALTGSVDGSVPGAQALMLTAGTSGTISLAANLGLATPLGAVTLSDKVLAIAPNIGVATSNADFAETGATVLQGSATTATIATAGGNIGFSGIIDDVSSGGQALALDAGSGTITLSGNVGGRKALGAITLVDAELDLAANVGITTADAAFSQTGATVLQGGATATATAIRTSGGNIGFAGTIDGTASGDQALTLNAGSGTIALSGAVGAGMALGAITLSDNELDIAPNVGITTSNAALSQTGTTVLLGAGASATVIDTTAGGTQAGANIAFSGDIEGGTAGLQALSLEAGTQGVISIGNMGAATALGALSFADAMLRIGVNATILTAGGAVEQQGPTVLLGAGATANVIATSSVADPGGANIGFTGPIDGSVGGKQALTVAAGTDGTIALSANLGQATPLGALSLTGAALTLAPNIAVVTEGGSVTVSGATLLAGDAAFDATGAGLKAAGANLAFAGTIDGGALSLDAGTGGTITLGANVGDATPLGVLTLNDRELDLAPDIAIATAGGPVSQSGTTVLLGGTSGGTVAVDTAGGAITFSSTIDATAPGAEALTLNAGAGTIALQGNVGATTALGAFTLSDAALDLPGNARIVTANGAVSQSGAMLLIGATATGATIDTTNGSTSAAGANITFAGTIDGGVAGDAALTLNAGSSGTISLQGNVGGATALGAVTLSDAELLVAANVDLTTASGAVAETGATVLLGTGPTATAIDTTNGGNSGTGANITFAGTVDGGIAGDQALTLNAGTGGTIALTASLGGATALGALTLTDSVLLLGENATITTAGGAVSQTGATLVQAEVPTPGGPGTIIPDPAIDTTAGGTALSGANVSFAGPIDATTDATGALPSSLAVNAGASGTIGFSANVGGHTPVGFLTLTDAELDLAPNVSITTGVSFSQTGGTVLLGGTQGTLTSISAGNCTVTVCDVGEIGFAGSIDGTAPGRQALTLNAVEITLQGNIGAGTPLGALTLTGADFLFAGNLAIATAGGAFKEEAVADLLPQTDLLPDGANPTTLVIDTNAGPAASAGANITFASNIAGGSPGLQSLSLDAGSGGTIALSGNIGMVTPLGALSLTDAALTLGANSTIATAGGAVSQTGATVLLAGGTTASVALIETQGGGGVGAPGANVTFTGTIDGDGSFKQVLAIEAGTGGTIALLGNVGSTTPLAGLVLNDTALELGPGLSVVLAPSISFDLDGTLVPGGSFVETGATVLQGGTGPTTTTVTGIDITFAGGIDGGAAGAQALTLKASTITLGGAVGAATPLGALTLNDTILAIGANVTVTTAGDAVSETGATMLLGGTAAAASVIDTAGGGASAGANVTFTGTIDGTAPGAQSLAVNAGTGGTIALQADVGATMALGALSLRDAVLSVPADFAVATAGGAVSQTGVTQVPGGASPVSLTVDTTGGGTVTTGANIAFGDVNGAAPGTLTLALDAGTGGTIALLGNVGSVAALAALMLHDAGLVIGPNASVTTAGTPFSETGATVLLGNGTNPTLATIDTTEGGKLSGADISFDGSIDGGATGRQSLTLEAGSADIALGGSVGAATPLGALTLDDRTLTLASGISVDTAGGAFSQSGATVLLDPPPAGTSATLVTIDTAAGAVSTGAGITFGGVIDGGTVGGQALSLNAGTGGTVSLSSSVGATVALGGLAVTGSTIVLGGSIYQTQEGAISTIGTLDLTAPMVTIASVIPLANNAPATTGATISLSSVAGPLTILTLDPGIDSVSINGGTLQKIIILEGHGSTLNNLTVGLASLGGFGSASGMTVGGFSGAFAAAHAFIRPGGQWTLNASQVLITDPALAGLTNSVLSNEGVGTAIALMVQIEQLIARGDTGETAAQQAFLQSPDRADYAVDPFRQRYNILGVAQENVGGFEDISYITDGFWEGLLKK